MKIIMYPVFHLLLKPLIRRNYRMREKGLIPDTWYWADRVSVRYGYFIEIEK